MAACDWKQKKGAMIFIVVSSSLVESVCSIKQIRFE